MQRPQPNERITIDMAKVTFVCSTVVNDYTTSERKWMFTHRLEDINGVKYSFIHKNKLAMEGEHITIVGTVKGYIGNNVIKLERIKLLSVHRGVTENA